jgi:hypothetical protein
MDLILFPTVDSKSTTEGYTVYKGSSLSLGLNYKDQIIISDNSYDSVKQEILSQYLKLLLSAKGSVITNQSEGTLFSSILAGNTSDDSFASDISACILDADSQMLAFYRSVGKSALYTPAAPVKFARSNLILADFATGTVSIKLLFTDGTNTAFSLVGRVIK